MGESANNAMLAGSIAAMSSNLVMAASLKLVWKMLGAVQLMVHLPMFKFGFPANSAEVFNKVLDLANFKLFNVDWLTELIFGENETGEENIISRLGLPFFALIFFLITLAIAGIIFFACKKATKVKALL